MEPLAPFLVGKNSMFSIFRREAKASTSAPLVALSQLGAAVWTRTDPRALAREGFERNAVGYRCIRMIAEAAAGVPMLADDPDHPAARLLARPNPEQAGVELMEAFYGHLQTAGNGFLHGLGLDDGPPLELHVLRPDRMTPMAGSRGWPAGWIYRTDHGERRFVRDADGWSPVLHLKLFHPGEDVMGFAPLQAAARAVDVHNAGAAWAKALIDNSARPSGALVYGKGGERLTDEQFDRLKQELEEAHMGASNAGRPMLLEGGLDWKPMGLTPSDMDFIAARHAAAREIALAFGVPPMMLGIPGDNTYSNYREANLAFWRLTVLPLVEKAARALNAWLGDRWERPVSFRADAASVSALAGEREALWAALNAADFMDADEKRAAAGLA